jgi:glycerate dehydrogenase
LDGCPLNTGDLSWAGLEALGEARIYDRTATSPKEAPFILERIADAEAVFTNKTPLTREILEKAPNIKFIGVLATGFNVVDTAAAKEKGIPVCNVPIYGTAAVAQTAIALLLELCHHVGEHNRAVQAGEWASCPDYSFWKYPLVELDGKTMGIIGLGRIGRRTAQLAQALGMEVLAYDLNQDPSIESGTLKYVDLDTLYAGSDVICLHCPQTPENTGMINKDAIAKMKDGVFVINNSRGPLIVDADLVAALKSGKVGGAGLDVATVEPLPADSAYMNVENCILTPHISWAPLAARARLMDAAVENLKAFQNGSPINVVNP